jgi:hypothetical protein
VYIYICVCVCIERERRDIIICIHMYTCVYMCVCVHIYIYIYIYIISNHMYITYHINIKVWFGHGPRAASEVHCCSASSTPNPVFGWRSSWHCLSYTACFYAFIVSSGELFCGSGSYISGLQTFYNHLRCSTAVLLLARATCDMLYIYEHRVSLDWFPAWLHCALCLCCAAVPVLCLLSLPAHRTPDVN